MIIIQANGAEGDLEEKILALLRREDIAAERVSLSSQHTLTFPELTIDGRSQKAVSYTHLHPKVPLYHRAVAWV